MGTFNSIASPLHDEINVPAGELPLGKPPTPNQMRQALIRVAHRSSPVLHRLWNMAQFEGLSGEDMYTAFAFYLQLEFENMQERLFRMAEHSISMPPLYVVKNGDTFK